MKLMTSLAVGLVAALGVLGTAVTAQAMPPTVTATQCVAGGGTVVTINGTLRCSGGDYDMYYVRG